MRITTSTIMRQYNSRLNSVLRNMNTASDRVTSGRAFNKASENPAGAARAYQMRREFLKNEDYISNLKEVQSHYDTVESSMMKVSKIAEDAYVDMLTGITGTTSPDQRQIIASKLREMQKAMVMDMNVAVGGQHLFGGAGSGEVPFKLDETTGVVTFRGVDVNTKIPSELAKLKQMSEEKIYIDLGFGLSEDGAGNIMDNSAFNMAMPGINVIGYGQTVDGSPKNVIALLGELANELEKPALNEAAMEKLTKTLDTQRNGIVVSATKLGSNTLFLEYTEKRLSDVKFTYNQKILDTEYMNPEEAITNFKMEDYVYRATLKMGMDILSPSFMDFMK